MRHLPSTSFVAQTCSLLYRRFSIGKARKLSWLPNTLVRAQNAILRYSRMQFCVTLSLLSTLPNLSYTASGASFDAAPFAQRLPEGNGLIWEDPREIHSVTVKFVDKAPSGDKVHLEYWGSHWPEQHLPKDRAPGGGDV